MKNKGDLERDCDELKAEIESHNNKVQVLERTVEHLKKIIDEKVSNYITKLQPNLSNVQLKYKNNVIWFLKSVCHKLIISILLMMNLLNFSSDELH